MGCVCKNGPWGFANHLVTPWQLMWGLGTAQRALWWLWGTRQGHFRGALLCWCSQLTALPGCSTGQTSGCLESALSCGFCCEQSSPAVFCCHRGVEKLQFHPWESLSSKVANPT